MEPHNHWVNAAKRTIQTFKDAFHIYISDNQHHLLPANVGWTCPPGAGHAQPPLGFADKSRHFGIQSPEFPVELGLVSTCSARLQDYHIQGTGCTRILGITRHWCVVLRSFEGPLPMQFVLCPQDMGAPHIGHRWTLPATFSGFKSQSNWTLKGTHWQVSNRKNKCLQNPQGKSPYQNPPDSPWFLDPAAPCWTVTT